MMQIEFKKDIQGHFMIIKPEGVDTNSYRFRMMLENSVDGLLPCMLSNIDGKETIKYNISGKIPLTDYLREYTAGERTLEKLLRRLVTIIESLQMYLIGSECILLEPEYVFASDNGEFYFVVYPHPLGSFSKNMLPLSELLIAKMPHNNQRAAAISYNLYQSCISECLSSEKIKKILSMSEESNDRRRNGSLPVFKEKEKDSFFDDESKEKYESFLREEPKRHLKVSENEKEKKKSRKNSDKKKKNKGLTFETRRADLKKQADKEKKTDGFIEKYFIKDSALMALFKKFGKRKSEVSQKERKEENREIYEPSDELEFVRSLIAEASSDNEGYDFALDEQRTVVMSKNSINRIDADCYLIPKDIFKGENIPLLLDEYSIGKRSAGADIDIEDSSVSRHHARLKKKENTYELTDTGSTNGTKVNGHLLKEEMPIALSDGDEVLFGAASYYFHIAK